MRRRHVGTAVALERHVRLDALEVVSARFRGAYAAFERVERGSVDEDVAISIGVTNAPTGNIALSTATLTRCFRASC